MIESARPLLSSPTRRRILSSCKLQKQHLKLHDLAQKCIASSKEFHRIQIKMTIIKHVNTAIVCQSLGQPAWRREDLLKRAKQ